MDKKNTIIGVLLLIAAFAYLKVAAPSPSPSAASTSTPVATSQPVGPTAIGTAPAGAPAPGAVTPTGSTSAAVETPSAVPAPVAPTTGLMFSPVAQDPADGQVVTLENKFISVRLTDFGGAVLDVAFKDYHAQQDQPDLPYVFNAKRSAPILAMTELAGLDPQMRYTLVSDSQSKTEVVFRAVLANGVEVTRRYTLLPQDEKQHDLKRDYLIRHETTFRNPADKPNVSSSAIALNLGTAGRVNARDFGTYLATVSYNGENAAFTGPGDFTSGLFTNLFGTRWEKDAVDQTGKVVWAAINNQFFTSIYTPDQDQPGVGIVSRRVQLGSAALPDIGMTGAARFLVPALTPGTTATLSGNLYVGPKEYVRLSEFDQKQSKVMQFDRSTYSRIFLSGYIAPAMNMLMNTMHRFIGNWGLAIILMTLLLKIVSVPFTLAASRSAKRMQKLQPLMKAIKEKHKDNPQKLNQATMALFKEHKVNPVGGCIPILITIPLFIGFFTMLQGTAELRFQSFLWATDLSGPDTVGHLFGFPINIMPLLMGATMIYQMRLTPSPSVDPAQQKMMKIMPIFFTAICYNFAAALALYSTVNGLFTIAQQLLVNKYATDNDPAALTGPGGRPVKNVTPKKK